MKNKSKNQAVVRNVDIETVKDNLTKKYKFQPSWFNGVTIDQESITIYTSCAIPKSTKAEIIADAAGYEVKFFNTGIVEAKLS